MGVSIDMRINPDCRLAFARLPDVSPHDILAHMTDPRIAAHMPLLKSQWNARTVADFIAAKEARWACDGLGHWAFLHDGVYAGWGGFQKEGDEWDFGLVLKADHFGLGPRIARKAIEFAKADGRIPYTTFLVPPSRRHLGGLARLGARFIGEVDYEGARFAKYRLDTK